ncbi:PIG-L family deacetylase [Mycobacterium sp.]|uniref:PIG-L family deacetylase n=1 Tax=Mycobacterium sp. TaxID=1785 RepID=UPI003F950070
MSGAPQPEPTSSALPAWSSVLAVVAHPDDESFGLGAILDAFNQAATRTAVLCLTHGEASTVRGVAGNLAELRGQEFAAAARMLGVSDLTLRDYPDGGLDQVRRSRLVGEVIDAARAAHAAGLLVFDPSGVTGHHDHAVASAAALLAAARLNLPVLGWTLPDSIATQLNRECGTGFVGHSAVAIEIELPVTRTRQVAASSAHVSQAIPTSVLWRRLELLGDIEHLRWLTPVKRYQHKNG